MARENFIGGAWVPARSGATDQVVEPATGEQLDEVASSDAADVDAAVAAAAAAFAEWAATTPRERCEMLHARSPTRSRPTSTTLQDARDRATSASPRRSSSSRWTSRVDNWRFFAGAARASSKAAPRASTWRSTRRSSAATRSASSRRSRRGTTRSTWPRGRSGPRSRPATPSCSSRRSSRRSPRCGSPRSPPTSSRPACSTS